jgi:hypothetical protein
MTEKPVVVVENGSGAEGAWVNLTALDRAEFASTGARELALALPENEPLRKAVVELSEAFELLLHEVQTLLVGLDGGRVTVGRE